MSFLENVFSGNKDPSNPVTAGTAKGQGEVRDEIYNEVTQVQEIQAKDGWSSKLKDVLDGGEARRKREEEEDRLRIQKEKEEAHRIVDSQRGWTDKIQDAIDGGKHKRELEEAEFQRLEHAALAEKKKNQTFVDKINNVIDTPDELRRKVQELTQGPRERAGEREEQEQEHLSDRVRSLWQDAPADEKRAQSEHHQTWKEKGDEEQSQREQGWREKLYALAGTSNKEEKQQTERGWLKEKLNNMAGGGVMSEANEDKLDKTIDLIQEHILKQGDQSNESALEQMKDEQISDAIRLAYRQVTGHELPIKDKS